MYFHPSSFYSTHATRPSILLLSTQPLLLVLPSLSSTEPLLLVLPSFSSLLNPFSLSFHPSPLYSTPPLPSYILLLATQPLLHALPSCSLLLNPCSSSFHPFPLSSTPAPRPAILSPLYSTPAPRPFIHLLSTQPLLLSSVHPSPLYSTPAPLIFPSISSLLNPCHIDSVCL